MYVFSYYSHACFRIVHIPQVLPFVGWMIISIVFLLISSFGAFMIFYIFRFIICFYFYVCNFTFLVRYI